VVPLAYEDATRRFRLLLRDARDAAGLVTTNQSFTMVEAVLRTFRRRLDVADALAFANVLPPLVRALFVADWDPREPRGEFDSRAALTDEVKSLRRDHNFSPDDAIRAVAVAVRRHVDGPAFDRILAGLPAGAADFWDASG
jgi:uncharacterized protein (DUF2267 family)